MVTLLKLLPNVGVTTVVPLSVIFTVFSSVGVLTFTLTVTLLKLLPNVGVTTVVPLSVIFTVFSSVGVGGTDTSTTTSFNTLPVSGYTFKI